MNYKEIEELAGHRPISAWVIKLVNDAIAIEREACVEICELLYDYGWLDAKGCAREIRARGNHG